MPTTQPKPLPQPLRYLQPFVRKLAKLGPEGHREQEIDAGPLDVAMRRRIRGMDRRSAEAALAEDRKRLTAWLNTTGGQDHPAYWILGYLSGAGLASHLRRPPPEARHKSKPPRRSGIVFDAPEGWTAKPGRWRLDLKTKGVVGLIEGMDRTSYLNARRLLKTIRPVPQPRGTPKVTVTSSSIRRGVCSGMKHIRRWSKPALSKQVHYLLQVPGGGVTIVLVTTGKADFDESPLESKLHTLRIQQRR